MSKITVWKCDTTGKLFENLTKYRTHLRKQVMKRREERKLQLQNDKADSWWNCAYQQRISINEWAEWVINNQDRFWGEASRCNYDWKYIGNTNGKQVCSVPRLVKLDVAVKWSSLVSNSHSAPHDGVQNWYRDTSLPDGYPGWHGSVSWQVEIPEKWSHLHLGGDLFRFHRARAYVGSGGGGLFKSSGNGSVIQRYNYDFRIFANDWPGMFHVDEQTRLMSILTE